MSVRERHRREREARGQAILAAASRVFARHGLEGATVEMVAREAEVAVGTIYLYFASRDDLYLSLIVDRVGQLRERYLEIQSRGLDPLAELHAIAAAYLDYLGKSRELFLAQQSVRYVQLARRLKRAAELRNFRRVIDLSHQVFKLYERTVKRACQAGLILNASDPTKTAAVIWASLNGAFLLMGEEGLFRDVTGLNPEHLIEEALESHLAPAGAARNGAQPGSAPRSHHRSNGAPRNGRAKHKFKDTKEATARASA
jgi:AcrR family transcriptional regulator